MTYRFILPIANMLGENLYQYRSRSRSGIELCRRELFNYIAMSQKLNLSIGRAADRLSPDS
jgi:hypothetical protein